MRRSPPRPDRERIAGALLASIAVAGAVVIALRAPWPWDYPRDAGPPLTAIAHGDFARFFAQQPAMGGLSLYLRAPFVAAAQAWGGGSYITLYRWGDIPCVVSVALAGLWLGRFARGRGSGRIGEAAIVAVCLLNPLVHDALLEGHPEELLTTSLAIASLLAAAEDRPLLTAVLAGCAIASKQWALVVVAPAVLILPRAHMRMAVLALTVAGGLTLPMIIGDPDAFRRALAYITTPQNRMTAFTWMYPFSPNAIVRVTDPNGATRVFWGARVLGVESLLSHPLIIGLGVAIPVGVWWRGARQPAARAMLAAAALVLLLRCVLDPESAPYYHVPILFVLLGLDALAGRRLPTAGIAGSIVAYLVFERFWPYLGNLQFNLLYIAVTGTAAALLVREIGIGTRPAAVVDPPPRGTAAMLPSSA